MLLVNGIAPVWERERERESLGTYCVIHYMYRQSQSFVHLRHENMSVQLDVVEEGCVASAENILVHW